MFERAALIHYHEIGLKGRNRSVFERKLLSNVQAAVGSLTDAPAERISSRVLVRATDPSRSCEIADRAAQVPGVSFVGDAYITARDIEEICQAAVLALGDVGAFATFAIEARRSATEFPLNSMEINRIVGQRVVEATGAKVNLSKPDVTVRIAVVQAYAYVYARKVPGVGGLPVGTAGRVVALLSAGIDSPVAAWRLMKRGAVVVGVHFSGRPQTADTSERIVADIGTELARFGGLGRIYIVPFGDLQREISLEAPPDLRVLLYRRLMIRIAEEVASFEHAKALVTGESLGQVASQTLDNIAAVDEAASLPVLRPLIGSDKLEIIGEARRLGTYRLSTQDHADCCTLFMPRNPATHASVKEVRDAESRLDMPRMITEAVHRMTYLDFPCDSYRRPRQLPEGVEPVSGVRA